MSRAAKRLMTELRELAADPKEAELKGIDSLQPSEADLFSWTGKLRGPPDTPFADSTLMVEIQVPKGYPLEAPTARFGGRVFHPNVKLNTGEICIDVLKMSWSPLWTLSFVLVAIRTLLETPEPDSPLNVDAANLVRCGDRAAYASLVKHYLE